MKNKFKIEHIDSLGQGVSKIGDKVTFIPKTLPGETGTYSIVKENKKVRFGKILKLETLSKERIEAECPHFDECKGCSFLHTNYSNELKFKSQNLERSLKWLSPEIKLESFGSEKRFNYRNRVQLHYDKKENLIGYRALENKILPVPGCLLPNEKIQNKFEEIQTSWKEILSSEPNRGHLEIYEFDEKVKLSFNSSYSQGGFTQVFEDMNQVLKNKLTDALDKKEHILALDLFGGKGNLTNSIGFPTLVVDSTPHKQEEFQPHQKYLCQNLYAEDALEKVQGVSSSADLLIIDPPRTGFKNLDSFVNAYSPKTIVYVSCFHQTLIRDLGPIIENYRPTFSGLFDFFPGTSHFETMVILEKTN